MAESYRGVTRLQSELEKAKENLKDIDENIKKLTGRDPTVKRRGIVPDDPTFRRVGGAFSRLGPRRGDRGDEEEDSGDDEESSHKPTVQSSVVATPKEERSRENSIEELSQDRKGQARNRRMFGLLLGTLQKFKHESEETKEKEEQRNKIEKKLDEKFKQEKEEILRERKQLFLERKQKQYRIRLIEQKMEMAQNIAHKVYILGSEHTETLAFDMEEPNVVLDHILSVKKFACAKLYNEHEEWERETRKLENFIRTKAKPHLFYMPKILTSDSETMLKETKITVNEMIDARQKKLEEEISDLMSRVHRSTGDGETDDEDDDNIVSMGDDGDESKGGRAEHRNKQQDQSPGKHDKENRDKRATEREVLSEREQRDRDREQRDRDRQMMDKRQAEMADKMDRERRDSIKEAGVERTNEQNRGGERGKGHVRHRERSRSHSIDHSREHKSGKRRSGNRKHKSEEKLLKSPSKHRLIGDEKAEKQKKKDWAPMEDEEEEEFVSSKSGTGEKESVSIQSKMLEMAGLSKIVKKRMTESEHMEINFQNQSENVADIPTPMCVYTDPEYFKEGSSGNTNGGGRDQIQVNDSETIDT